jgi:hypothetical protein
LNVGFKQTDQYAFRLNPLEFSMRSFQSKNV